MIGLVTLVQMEKRAK